MHHLFYLTALLSLHVGSSFAVNEKFEILNVNTLPAPVHQKSWPSHDGPFPFLLNTFMRLPQDIDQPYLIRTTIVPNANDEGKVLSVVYNSDYDGYGDIMDYTIEEGASEIVESGRTAPNGKWRIRFIPESETWSDVDIQIKFVVEDPAGRLYTGGEVLPCQPTPNFGGFYCVKRQIPLSKYQA